MRHGFIRIGAATCDVKVADVEFNGEQIRAQIDEACKQGVRILGFPELCVTSYTCGDLFLQESLIVAAKKEVIKIAKHTKGKNILIVLGFPFSYHGSLYNCAAVLFEGVVLGIVPKKHLPNYSEFYEARHFASGIHKVEMVRFGEWEVPFGIDQLFACENIPELMVGVEICEDLWVPNPPSTQHALAGATLIINTSASDETTGKDLYRTDLVRSQSARLICGYMYASAGEGESTTDLVFSGHNLITENGALLAESQRFVNEMVFTELDVKKLISERRKMTTFLTKDDENYVRTYFKYDEQVVCDDIVLTRYYDNAPFVPNSKADRDKRCDEIMKLQAMGLKKRMVHTGVKNVVLGISGGLDSTLALLVTVEAFQMLNYDLKGIIAVTMPSFGTTDRTYQNACELTKRIGATLIEIPIRDAVLQHFKDIGHDPEVHDLTFENAQARERTQVLMDLSSRYNGFVVGTGDMSELALGWATYNGDHMSMYGVNTSVPKTLVKYLVSYFADHHSFNDIREILQDILDTPVSPELLPPTDGKISQRTEELVGPYELHDFYLYYVLRYGFEPSKIYRIACYAFEGIYEKETIYQWLRKFYWRFFSQQFKRSCLPDGPKIGSVALSPRGDLRMPSDACVTLWMKDLDSIQI